MLKSVTGKIESCVVKKTGTSDKGKAWIIYNVTINGEQFSTFDTKYTSNIGKEGTFEYDEVQKGQFLNKTLGSYPEVQVPSGMGGAGGHPTVLVDNMMRGFGILRGDIQKMKEAIEMRLDAMDGKLASSINTEEPLPEEPPAESPPSDIIRDEDIPVINS